MVREKIKKIELSKFYNLDQESKYTNQILEDFYKRLNFTSGSLRLRKSVFLILEKLNLDPKMRNNRSVQIENKNKIREYFKIIGTSNPKHKRRFTEECGEWQASSLENCSL